MGGKGKPKMMPIVEDINLTEENFYKITKGLNVKSYDNNLADRIF